MEKAFELLSNKLFGLFLGFLRSFFLFWRQSRFLLALSTASLFFAHVMSPVFRMLFSNDAPTSVRINPMVSGYRIDHGCRMGLFFGKVSDADHAKSSASCDTRCVWDAYDLPVMSSDTE